MSRIKGFIKSYKDHTFSSSPKTGVDYEAFQIGFQNILKEITKDIDARLYTFNRGHYEFSAFIEREGNFVYVSISDVRGGGTNWMDNILIRTAESPDDYTGGSNIFTDINTLENEIDNLLK